MPCKQLSSVITRTLQQTDVLKSPRIICLAVKTCINRVLSGFQYLHPENCRTVLENRKITKKLNEKGGKILVSKFPSQKLQWTKLKDCESSSNYELKVWESKASDSFYRRKNLWFPRKILHLPVNFWEKKSKENQLKLIPKCPSTHWSS